MFSAAVQPSIVSLFSSTGSSPLDLFSTHTDVSLPSDSFICLMKDSTSQPAPPPPASLISLAHGTDEDKTVAPDYALDQTVLHIQSPTLKTTYIRCPPAGWTGTGRAAHGRNGDLGMQHPWIHLQVRTLGREWSFEVGIVDQSGREGIVRCSTFQKDPHLKLSSPPLLHLPLAFPPPSSHPLTSWSTISLNLPSLLPHFSSASLTNARDENERNTDSHLSHTRDDPASNRSRVPVPSGTYSHVSYVKVYATCRLRRVWFSEGGPRQQVPWEFELYAVD
ncbi:uncharacterized protein LAESUDRAFT_664350 [Laetiporus sulphureus 93-53]|uniref:CFA20 domain-containing protein n=1 Tax=Laetiporus sulphureus 93-53 TaxID=1314785 RepID=A0A165BK01_9APHY|nr:uncharacterized protein LAESUDRAFT_664350 [Laetiporus sulphureus 93-53]KZT01200.1 hypothetical protein LAESUDRAFT_664350 [Laetiporus sulphureus 93-53]